MIDITVHHRRSSHIHVVISVYASLLAYPLPFVSVCFRFRCSELFRTGPRPRRKGVAVSKADGASDTHSGTRTPVAHTESANTKNTQIEEMYKQCNPNTQRPPPSPPLPPPPTPPPHSDHGDPAYQNMDGLDPGTSASSRAAATGGRAGGHVAGTGTGTGSAVEPGGRSRNVGRHSVRMACSPEESEHLLPPPPPHPAQFACAGSSSSSSASALPRSHNRRYPAWQAQRQRGGRGSRRLAVLSACFRGGRKVHEEEEEEEEEEVRFRQKLPIRSSSDARSLTLDVGDGGGGRGRNLRSACVEVHTNTASSPLTKHPNCMLVDPAGAPAHGRRLSPRASASLAPPTSTSTTPKHISVSPSRSAEDRLSEEFELGRLANLPMSLAEGSEDPRAELRNRGSLSNISELSFDKPLSESSLKLGITAESLQAAMTDMDAGRPPTAMARTVAEDGDGDGDREGDGSAHPPPALPSSPSKPPDGEDGCEQDALCGDPRVLQLSRSKKDWSLDSGRSTMPSSRNGSMEMASDPATHWGTVNGKRSGPPTASLASPSPRDGNLTFRQSLDNARAARKNANSLPLAFPSSLHSPSASGPSSLASNSPGLRHQRLGGRPPAVLASPGGRSVCDSCRKTMSPGDVSYTSDTADSLSEMSDRSGMETTV